MINGDLLEQLGTLVLVAIFVPLGECLVLQNGHNLDFKLAKGNKHLPAFL